MAWDKTTGDALGRGARFLKRLCALKPGERIDLPMVEFRDMLLPISPLDRPTWEEKAEWFRARAPFFCRKWKRAEDDAWIFERQSIHQRDSALSEGRTPPAQDDRSHAQNPSPVVSRQGGEE